MKRNFWLLASVCVLSACGAHEQTSTASVPAASTASAEHQSLSQAMPVTIDPALVTSVDQQLQALQKKLPYEQNGNELTSVTRHHQYVYYHYRVLDKQYNHRNFDTAQAKKQLLENCRHNTTRRILTGGFQFVYVYTFSDHTQSSIQLKGTDCS
ncbi:hypothetical protein PT286_01430 [Neisseriaceae bacterium ESL0693]|nr:hypothetical protein [Neisseriaceae bacterium ESL0693]